MEIRSTANDYRASREENVNDAHKLIMIKTQTSKRCGILNQLTLIFINDVKYTFYIRNLN